MRQQRLSGLSLDMRVVIKVNVSVDHPVGLRKGSRLVAISALRFEKGEAVFSHSIVVWFPFLDMAGVMPYCFISWKYA